MARIISIHEYVLKPDADEAAFEEAVRKAEEAGWLELPGLIEHHFLKGIRGSWEGLYTMVWVYESVEAWARIWGPVGQPVSKEEYPENWKRWENKVLGPFLTGDPDKISFTAYRER